MSVNTDPAQINPFTSTVPLVQLPPSAVDQETRPAQPLEGQFKGKGTGALALGDALLKGIMAGHQVKEQKKQAQAQATIAAADGATQAAWSQYQDALTKAGGKQDDPAAQAAYQAYTNVFNQSKQAKAQFVIPEKQGKGGQKTGDGKGKKDQKTGWANFKDFFEANPHIVPAIALATMQPKPPGLAPDTQSQILETQRQQQVLDQGKLQAQEAQQKKADTDLVAGYASLKPEEISALPPEQQKALAAAKFRLSQGKPPVPKYDLFTDEVGNQHSLQEGADIPPGWTRVERTTAGTGLGSESWVLTRAAQMWGIPVGQLTPADKNYLDGMAAYAKKRAQLTASASGTSTNIQGDRESWIRQQIGPPPTPPNGRSAIDAATFAQGGQGIGPPPGAAASPTGQGKQPITPPPVAPKTAKAGSGAIQPPPRGKQTWQTTQRAIGFNTQRQNAYATAQKDYDNAVLSKKDASGNPIDPKVAATQLAQKKNSIDAAYRNQMKTAKLPPGDVYVYLVDPNTGTSWQRTVPDEQTVDDLRKYAQSNGKQFENLTNDEIDGVVQAVKKLNAGDGQVTFTLPNGGTIGGTPGSEQPKQYRYQTNPNDQGVVLGSDDGQNWVDTRTGQPYQQ